jgi:hypothetical protein
VWRATPWALLAVLALATAACNDDSSFDLKETSEFIFNFTLTSSNGNFTNGDKVTFLLGDCNNSSCGTKTNIRQVFTGTVSGGVVAVNTSVFYDFDRYYFFSMYVDKEPNGVLSNNDIVWRSGNITPTNTFTVFVDKGWLLMKDVQNRGDFEQDGTFAGSVWNGGTASW